MSLQRILVGLVALCVAYVVGRAAGILLGIGPYPTQAAAVAIALVMLVRAEMRRRRRAPEGQQASAGPSDHGV